MKLKNEKAWQEWVDNNQDSYGSAVVRYAEQWANLMEKRIKPWAKPLESVADKASHDADTEGITGFMYGCAVSMLATCWIHGERLRHWHNLKMQIRNEGERANRAGTVLNPALLVLDIS